MHNDHRQWRGTQNTTDGLIHLSQILAPQVLFQEISCIHAWTRCRRHVIVRHTQKRCLPNYSPTSPCLGYSNDKLLPLVFPGWTFLCHALKIAYSFAEYSQEGYLRNCISDGCLLNQPKEEDYIEQIPRLLGLDTSSQLGPCLCRSDMENAKDAQKNSCSIPDFYFGWRLGSPTLLS